MISTAIASAPAVRIDGQLAVVEFDRFDLDSYRLFLRAKALPETQVTYDWRADTYRLTTPARFADRIGADVPVAVGTRPPIAGYLFDYQRWIVGLALDARRWAAWIDTGLGKTAILLEWSRQVRAMTGGRVLILQPLGIHQQTIDMARAFYGDDLVIDRLETREALAAWCARPGSGIGICNYEKLIPGQIPTFRHLAGLAADESSMLRTGGGTIKWNLIHSARGIEYKLSLTATPAPNEAMEYASQASFLEKLRTEGDILWTYFQRDAKTNDWRVKPHARAAFYEFMASWSVYLRDPARFGFADILSTLPAPIIREHELPLSDVQREMLYGLIGKKGGLFSDDRLTLSERSKLSQLAKGFLYRTDGGKRTAARYPSAKPATVASLTAEHVRAGRQVMVWTVFDEEGEIVAAHLPAGVSHATLTGKQSDAERARIIAAFKAGEIDALLSKAVLLGYGLNLQNCRAMVFSGIDDSFERLYQSIRRAYRFGQTETVHVEIPIIPELEGTVFANVRRKEAAFDEDTRIQEEHYRRVLLGAA